MEMSPGGNKFCTDCDGMKGPGLHECTPRRGGSEVLGVLTGQVGPGMKTTAVCDKCRERLIVDVPLGAQVARTADRALAEHNKTEHP